MTPFFRRSKRLGVWLLMTLAVCVPISGCQTSLFGWSSPEMVARVATPDGAPVAGAIVVANWNIEGPWNGASLGQLAIAEAVTDQNGTFRIPAWGPRSPAKGHIRIDEPTVRIFKLGFFPLIIYNYDGMPMKAANSTIVFRLQNQTIELTPFKGSLREYELPLGKLQDSLLSIYRYQNDDSCYWKEMPRILVAIEKLKIKLAEQGAGSTLRSAYMYAGPNEPQCGDAKQFFMKYGNE